MADKRSDLIIFTALPFESRICRPLLLLREQLRGVPVNIPVYRGLVSGCKTLLIQTGISATKLRELPGTDDLLPRCGILSAGLAGGLSAEIRGGSVITAEEIISGSNLFHSDPTLLSILKKSGAIQISRIATTDKMISTREKKSILANQAKAQAVDMESGIIAEWAFERNIPFALIRGISDPASSCLPGIITKKKISFSSLSALPALFPLAFRSLKARKEIVRVLIRACGEISST